MFDELTGNSRVKAVLKRMLVSDRLPGAMLFTGEEGIGKKLFALEIARALNCRTPKDHEACGVCSSCVRIRRLNYPTRDDADEWTQIIWTDHPDVGLVVAPKRVLRVEQMRQIEKEANFRPFEGKARVFLIDEADKLNDASANALLKVLEEKRFRRLGDVRDRQVDVRLIAATHQDIGQLVREKRFRDDLYFRISTIPLSFPSLRERIEDIPTLAQYLLDKVSADLGRGELRLDQGCIQALQAYSWPGNIRELRNVIERAVLLSDQKHITLNDLHFDGHAQLSAPFFDSNLTLLELEKQHIERVLHEEHGRVEKAAKRLGIPRSSLYQKIKKHQISTSKV